MNTKQKGHCLQRLVLKIPQIKLEIRESQNL